jgi:methylaspartate ammonia-lyase
MSVSITAIDVVVTESAFFRDDQAAIRAGAAGDGFIYRGSPITPGFTSIREPGRALTLVFGLSDGSTVTGDCVEVQYPGVGGRDEPLSPERGARLVRAVLAPALNGRSVDNFRGLAQSLRQLELPVWVRYGASQALLRAAAHAGRVPMARVICEQWQLPTPRASVPVFAQCGDSPYDAVDRMILKRVDALPHGLINNVDSRLGRRGEILLELVRWLRDRVVELRADDAYRPVLQFDVYGTIGLAFGDTRSIADYLERLASAAEPFRLRIEHPLDGGSRRAQIQQLGWLRADLHARGCEVELIADEWCNTLADIEAFAIARCVDMIQVKVPDLGGIDETVEGLLLCKRHAIAAYCGGSCNETAASAQVSAHIALACQADLVLAKPGMGVDEGLSLVRNEMAVALAELDRHAPVRAAMGANGGKVA